MLELSCQLAHAAALLGRPAACRHALRRADGLQTELASHSSAWGDANELATFRRAELARDAKRVAEYSSRHLGRASASARRLAPHFCRTLLFSSRLAGAAGAAGAPSGGDALAATLLEALTRTAGLRQACRLGLAAEVDGDGRR